MTASAMLAAGALLSTGFIPVSSQPADLLATAAADSSDNIEHVFNHLYANTHPGSRPGAGTDLEFATMTFEVSPGRPEKGKGKGKGKPAAPPVVVERTYGFMGTYFNGLHVFDLTDDPGQPVPVGHYDCSVRQGDVQVFQRDDRWYVAYTHDTGYAAPESSCQRDAAALGFTPGVGTYIVDVTDPTTPALAAFVPFAKGSHNQTVHPSGMYLYNSNSDLITSVVGSRAAGIEVVDISDLGSPHEVAYLPLPIRPGLGTESHDITFNAEGTRAYSAALSQTVVIDTEDPADPQIISTTVDPMINVEHQANPVTITDPILGTREFLVIEDEVAGATATGQCPNGGVHVYDITGELEASPVKVGFWNIDDVGLTTNGVGRCTAHVFELHEDEALMTIAYYNGGIRVVDISGLVGVAIGGVGVGMRELARFRFDDSDTWAVKAPFVDRDGVFHIYGNDQTRGLDVYRVDLSDPAASSANPGEWLAPAQLSARMAGLPVFELSADTLFRCLLPPA